MKKLIFIFIVLNLFAFPFFAKDEDENISDITESQHYEKGQFITDKEGNTLDIKKGQGFDFKVPEIVITGQIDTKIILNKEMRLMENISNVKDILYEKEKIYMPDQYLKEENIMPQKAEKILNKEYALKLKVSAGSYEDFFVETLFGKELEKNSNIVLKVFHKNYANEIINDRKTYRNKNKIYCYYKTQYDFLDTVYGINAYFDRFTNPFPENLFKSEYRQDKINASINLIPDFANEDFSFKIKYDYFGQKNSSDEYIYKENRFTNDIDFSKIFILENKNKVKLLLNTSYFISDIFSINDQKVNSYYVSPVLKGIFYLNELQFHGGIKLQLFKMKEMFFRASPYIGVIYDLTSFVSLFGYFEPQMEQIDFIGKLNNPFIIANENLKPATDNVNLKTGININIINLNFDIYYGYKSVNNYVIIDEDNNTKLFTFYNKNIDYYFAGINLETVKLQDFLFEINYEYKNLIESGGEKITYFPEHSLSADIAFNKYDWEFNLSLTGETEQYGTTELLKISPYLILDFNIKKKISDKISVYGYLNNILNNKYYLLYYYPEKGLNLGLGIILTF